MTDERTVLITDMEGSTAYTQQQGDEVAMDLLRTHERLVREVVASHGGREIKSMGDGFMIVFPDAEGGIECALDVLDALQKHNASAPDEPILVRIGLNTGTFIEEGGDIYGTTVNAAARIAAKARAGQILLSEATRNASAAASAAGSGRTFIDRGLFWLKGLRERWRLYETARGADVMRAPVTIDGRSPFVDRETERAALRVYVDSAMEGRGGLVLLSGDAGTGKSRLAEEIGLEAEGRGMRYLVGRCYEAGRGHPFAPFVDILEAVERDASPLQFRMILGDAAGEIARLLPHIRRRYPDIPPPAELPPDQERRYLFARIREVLAGMADQRPLCVHLDDLHWADEPSLLFLEQLAPDLGDLPIFIVGTYTQPELAGSPALQSAIEKMQRRRSVDRITLGPFSAVDVADLLRAMSGTEPPSGLVRQMHRDTEGNPFFLEEVIRHLDEQGRLFDDQGNWLPGVGTFELGVPETVRLTIGRRLDGLSHTTRHVLTTAAIIGRAFGFDLLEDLQDVDEDELLDAIDEAERANVITSTTEGELVRFRFAHELTRQTLINDVSLTRRQLLHLQVADAMERVYSLSLSEHAADLAYHLAQAGRRAEHSRQVRFLVMAGERALEAAAYEDAVRHLDRALSLLPPSEVASRAPVLERLAMAERSLGLPEDAIATWNEALDAYEEIGEPDAVARLCMDAGIQVAWWLRNGDARRLAARGLDALGDRETPHRGGLVALRAIVASNQGAYEVAEEQFEEALALARRHEDPRVLGRVLYSMTAHRFTYAQHERAIETGTESIDYLRSSGDLWNLANVLGFVGQSLGFIGRFNEAATITEGAKDLAQGLGNWTAYIYIDRARAWRHLANEPDPGRLEADGQRDLDLGERLGYQWMCAVGYTRMGHASFLAGRWEEAVERAEKAAALDAGPLQGHLGRLVLLNAYLGNADAARGYWDELKRWEVPPPGTPSRFGIWDAFLASLEGLAVLGETEEAARLYPMAKEAAGPDHRLFRGWDYRVQHTVAGVSAACAELWDAADQHFADAARVIDTLPYVPEKPELLRFHAWMLLRRARPGDVDRARELLTEAIERYTTLGMPRHRALAESMRDQSA